MSTKDYGISIEQEIGLTLFCQFCWMGVKTECVSVWSVNELTVSISRYELYTNHDMIIFYGYCNP